MERPNHVRVRAPKRAHTSEPASLVFYAVDMAISRDVLIEILAQADPVGLVAAGGPRDEYASEADEILGLQGVPQLTEITGVFAVSFSDPGACPRETARWIVEEMQRLDPAT